MDFKVEPDILSDVIDAPAFNNEYNLTEDIITLFNRYSHTDARFHVQHMIDSLIVFVHNSELVKDGQVHPDTEKWIEKMQNLKWENK